MLEDTNIALTITKAASVVGRGGEMINALRRDRD